MVKAGIAEIAGIFLIIVGFAAAVVAAALVSTALAVAVFAVLATFAGVVVVYVANVLSAQKPETRP